MFVKKLILTVSPQNLISAFASRNIQKYDGKVIIHPVFNFNQTIQSSFRF